MTGFNEYIAIFESKTDLNISSVSGIVVAELATIGYNFMSSKKIEKSDCYGLECSFSGPIQYSVQILNNGLNIEINDSFLSQKYVDIKTSELFFIIVLRKLLQRFHGFLNALVVINRDELNEYYSRLNFNLFNEPLIGNKLDILTFRYWIIFLSKTLVSEIGQDVLLNCPAYKKESIDSGIFLLNGPFPPSVVKNNTLDNSKKSSNYFSEILKKSERHPHSIHN